MAYKYSVMHLLGTNSYRGRNLGGKEGRKFLQLVLRSWTPFLLSYKWNCKTMDFTFFFHNKAKLIKSEGMHKYGYRVQYYILLMYLYDVMTESLNVVF